MKRRISIFILFLIELVVCTTISADVASDRAGVNGLYPYELETTSVHDYDSHASLDCALGVPAGSDMLTSCGNIYSGHARTIGRSMRSMYRYNPIAFLKNGRFRNDTFNRYLRRGHHVAVSVKLSWRHGFIRLRKLLI